MHLKICGLRQSENIKSLLPVQPDYLGFIFFEKSKRYAEGALEVDFIKNETGIIKTGVFVNESIEKVKAIIENHLEIKAEQEKNGYRFTSGTDTEVVVHQIHEFLDQGQSLLESVKLTVQKLQGAYALGVMSTDHPGTTNLHSNHHPL